MTRREQMVIGVFSTAIIAGSAAVFLAGNGDNPETPPDVPAVIDAAPVPLPEPFDETVAPPVAPDPAEVAVAVQGAVRSPGLYRLDAEARVQDLIDAGGGLLENADISSLNVAARLIDGTTLTVPETIEAEGRGRWNRRRDPVWNPAAYTLYGSAALESAPAAGPASVSAHGADAVSARNEQKLDLNRASADDLESLPGIGPKLAEAIIEYRSVVPFRTVDDLMQVSGIGEKRLAAIRGLVKVE